MGKFGYGQGQDEGQSQEQHDGRSHNGQHPQEQVITTNAANNQASDNGLKKLSFSQTYPCPACGSGELSGIALMDVFGCDFCRHLFTANLSTQSVQLADSLPAMAWHWKSNRWRTAYQGDTATTPLIWSFCSGLTIAPVGLIALSNYVFPPLEGSNFPLMWTGLTLLGHSVMSIWLLAEYHRWPWYVASKIYLQRFQRAIAAHE